MSDAFDYHKAITKKERSSRYIRTAFDFLTQEKGEEATNKFLEKMGIARESSIFKHIYDDENWNSYDLEVYIYDHIKNEFDDQFRAIWEFGIASGSGKLDQKDNLFTFKIKIAPMMTLLKKIGEQTVRISKISVVDAFLVKNNAEAARGILTGEIHFKYSMLPEGYKYPHWTSIVAGFGTIYGIINVRKGLACNVNITHYPNLPSDMPHFNNKVYVFEKDTKNILEKSSGQIIANAKGGPFTVDGVVFNNGIEAVARFEWQPESIWKKIARNTYELPRARREERERILKDEIVNELSREHQLQLGRYEQELSEKARIIEEKMNEIQLLKVQQDGDYFLTSLLAKPLFYNANKSETVKSEFIIKQKKNFEFRNKFADLGGDICVTGNLKFGTAEKFSRYTMAMNGDAMGKSMQGAGGSLVMGVVMNSIMARSAGNKRIMETTPEAWLTDVYREIHSVFKSFNGSMVISCVVALIDNETGEMWYFNAEHPFTVLYRDGKASFIEEELLLRKLGLDSEIEFKVMKFQLQPGDIVIQASDGRDDLDTTPHEAFRTISDDETLFLKRVEEAKADLVEIEKGIRAYGYVTDDLSMLRIGFRETNVTELSSNQVIDVQVSGEITIEGKNVESYFAEAKIFLRDGATDDAIRVLSDGYRISQSNQRLNKLLGLLSFKGKDYNTAVELLGRYLDYDPDIADFWYYLSVAEKKLGRYDSALQAALKLKTLQPENLLNLINLSDLNRLKGNVREAKGYCNDALKLDATNRNAKKLFEMLNR